MLWAQPASLTQKKNYACDGIDFQLWIYTPLVLSWGYQGARSGVQRQFSDSMS